MTITDIERLERYVAMLRHECAYNGPCSDNGDGCICSAAELHNRKQSAALRQSSPPDGQTAGTEHAKRLRETAAVLAAERLFALRQSSDGWTYDMASAPHDHKIAVVWVDSYSAHDPGGWKYTLGMTFWNDGHWANAPSSHWHAVAWSEFPPFTPTKAPGEEH